MASARERLESRGVRVLVWATRDVSGWASDKVGSVVERSAAGTVVNLRPGLSPRELEAWLCFALRLLTGEEEPDPAWGMGYLPDRGAWRSAELYRARPGDLPPRLIVCAVVGTTVPNSTPVEAGSS